MEQLSLAWMPDAWEDYLYWQTQDRKTLKRVNALVKEVLRSPFDGTGMPEPLRGDLAGAWSRRIDARHRLVYEVRDRQVVILACRSHYGDH